MASRGWTSKEFTNFGNKCLNTYNKSKSKNENDFNSMCQEFGGEFKKALNAELGFKLNYCTNNALRVKYEGITMESVVNKLVVADNNDALKDFDNGVTKFNTDTANYFNNIRSNFELAHKDLSNVQNSIKGHFQSFYKTCIACAENLEGEKNIIASLKEIVTACNMYLANSKKVTIKKSFFKKSIDLNGRAACIFQIKNAANHLAKLKI